LTVLRIFTVLTRYGPVRDLLLADNAFLIVLRASRKSLLKSTSGNTAIQNLITLIMRHLNETPAALERVMEGELAYKMISRVRPTDVKHFCTLHDSILLRDPETFIRVAGRMCVLSRSEIGDRNIQISLSDEYLEMPDKRLEEKKKREVSLSSVVGSNLGSQTNMSISATDVSMGKDESGTATPVSGRVTPVTASAIVSAVKEIEAFSPLVKPLIEELMILGWESGAPAVFAEPAAIEDEAAAFAAHYAHFYRCFIMQIMAEMATSYPNFARDVIHYCKFMHICPGQWQ
jgi:hypothetical protein